MGINKIVYSIMLWNIHGANGYGLYKTPDFVINKVLSEKKDIVILTEFIRASEWKAICERFSNYYWIYTYPTPSQNNNEILIMIKKGLFVIEQSNDMGNLVPIILSENKINPDFLEIPLSTNKNTLHIIGMRIRDKDHIPQFDILKNYLNSLPKNDLVICGGDFNEWANPIKAKIPTGYSVNTPRYKMIPNDFQSLSTWSAVSKNKNTEKTGKAIIDHIVSKNILSVSLSDYLWDFVSKDNGYGSRKSDEYKSDLPCLPDHGILIGEFRI